VVFPSDFADHRGLECLAVFLWEPLQVTRYCMTCQNVIGEKCPQCGDETKAFVSQNFAINGNGRAIAGPADLGVDIFLCLNPRCYVENFLRGAGGRTDGLCGECKTKMLLGEIEPRGLGNVKKG
jgi:hypothetical protein